MADHGPQHCFRGRSLKEPLFDERSIMQFVVRHAAERPTAPCITALDRSSPKSYTYADIATDVRAQAAWMQTEVEFDPKTIVGVEMRNDVRSVINVLSILATGATAVVLAPDDPPTRARAKLTQAGARYVIGRKVPGLQTVETLEPGRSPRFSPPSLDTKSPGLVFFSSGSTGVAKGVVQSHYGSLVNAVATARHHNLSRRDVLLGCLPLSHVNGLHFTLFSTIVAGGNLVLAPEFDPFQAARWVSLYRPRIFSVVPSILRCLVEMEPSKSQFDALGYFVTAAAPLDGATSADTERVLGARVIQSYGLSETTNFTSSLPTDLPRDLERRLMARDNPPVGRALFGNEVAIFADASYNRGPGPTGEVCVRGHNVMLGYLGQSSLTADSFRGGWFHTGDVGQLESLGGHYMLTLTGREKNLVKVAGVSVSLEEVDHVLLGHNLVADAATVSLRDSELGERIIAFIRPKGSLDHQELWRHIVVYLPMSHMPSECYLVDKVPRTPTGKIEREQLLEIMSDRRAPVQLLWRLR